MIDALYAFSDCEVSVSPNSCVIDHDKPYFLGINDILKRCTENTQGLLKKELEIRLNELEEEWHLYSLEKIFIVNELYENIKTCKTEEEILSTIDESLKPFVKNLRRQVTQEDLVRLSNIPIKRISKFSTFKTDEHIKSVESEMEEVKNHIAHIIIYTINYFRQIKKKYGKGRERKTEIRSFDTIEATHVVVANEKMYVNRAEGFIGTGLKKEEMSIPARIMAIADIFEALTAADRPYKKPKTLSEALRIMSFMRNDKHIDAELFDLFLQSRVYLNYAEQFLDPSQIDEVDVDQYLQSDGS